MANLSASLSNGFARPEAATGPISGVTGVPPGTYLCGTLWDYTQIAHVDIDEVQYTRVYFISGKIITKMAYFQSLGGGAGRDVRLGIYEQTNPQDTNGVPSIKVAETVPISTAGLDGQYVDASLTTPYTVLLEGYYWLAMVTNNVTDLLVAATEMYGPDFLPIRRGPTTGIVLPASPGIVVNPSSATALVLALEA